MYNKNAGSLKVENELILQIYKVKEHAIGWVKKALFGFVCSVV